MDTIDNRRIDAGLQEMRLQTDRRTATYLNSCVHCGLCAESCLYYLAIKDDRMIPARKVEVVNALYRRYFTFSGRLLPWLNHARELDASTLSDMVDLLYGGCTLCGRCSLHCSVGLDITQVIRTGRAILSQMDCVPKTLQSTVNAAIETGNNMAIPESEFVDTLKWMEEELQDETGDPGARIPVNEKGRTVLYTLNPREPKFFPLSISAMAKIFYAADESWTLSTQMYDVTNYAYFSGHSGEARQIALRLWDEMTHLGCTSLVLAECGHGSLAFRWESPNYLGKTFPFRVKTSVEWIAGYIRENKIRLDKEKINEPVTLHDPCNLVRYGGVIGEQRYILRNFIQDFREMSPSGVDNFCCGGGGGQLAMSEYNDRRLKIAGIKADQIRKTGAKIVVTPCHNCVDQLTQINAVFKLGVKIKTMAEIVADALIL